MTKLRLDLQLVLPGVPDDDDACVGRLIEELRGRHGIEEIHVRPGAGDTPAELCVHYDAAVLPLVRIRELVEGTGAAISDRYGHAQWRVSGITHARRARTIAEHLQSLTGVLEAEASAAGRVQVEFDRRHVSEVDLLAALAKLKVTPIEAGAVAPADHDDAKHVHREGEEPHDHGKEDTGHGHAHGGILGPNTELIFALTCGALLLVGFLIEKFAASLPGWLPTACYIGAYFFGGFYTLREAYRQPASSSASKSTP
jgi:Cd2+/Zn2+-exporting ATPase